MFLLLSLNVLLILKAFAVLGKECFNFVTPGFTTPKEDILMRAGGTLIINCTLRDINATQTSHHLSWKTERNETNAKFVIKPITKEMAQLTVYNITPEDSGMYYCVLNKSQSVCHNLVDVGFPPPKIEKINCTFQKWQYWKCTWMQDRTKHVKTTWKFYYFVNNRRKNCTKYLMYQTGRGEEPYGCIIEDTPSLLVMPLLRVEVNASNGLKPDFVKEFQLDLYKLAVLPPPNVTLASHIKNKATIKWTLHLMKKLNVTCIVSYKCMCKVCKENYIQVNYTGERYTELPYNLTIGNLLWYNKYTVGVKCQLLQTDIPHIWSPQTNITFSVEASVPERSPTFNVGSYMQTIKKDVRNVIVYWQSIPECERNSAKIKYHLQCGKLNYSTESTNYFIKGLNNTMSYNFTLTACNEKGCAHNSSYVYIPEVSPAYPQIGVYAVYYFNNQKKGQYTYEVSWKKMAQNSSLKYYSIFKCLVKDSEVNDNQICKESELTKVKEIEAAESVYLPFPESQEKYKFAVALHNHSHSGGLTWTTCQKNADEVLQEIGDIVVTHEDVTWASISWDIPDNCILKSTSGYKIVYKNLDKHTENNIKIDDVFDKKINLTGLTPGSHYKLTLFMLRKSVHNISRSIDFRTKPEKPASSSLNGVEIIIGILAALCGLILLSVIAACLVQKIKSKIKELKNIQVPTGFREDSNFPLITTVTPSPPCEKLTNGSHSSGFGSDCPESTTSSPTMSFTCIHPTTDLDTPRIAATDLVFEYPSISPLENYSLVGSIAAQEMQTLDVSALHALEREPEATGETVYYAKLSILPEPELQETFEIGHEDDVQSPSCMAKGYTSVTASDLMEPYVKLALTENTTSSNSPQVDNSCSVFPSIVESSKVETETVLLPRESRQEPLTSGSNPGYITCKSLTGTIPDTYIRLSDENQNFVNDVFSSNDEEFDEISLNEYFETSSNQSEDLNG